MAKFVPLFIELYGQKMSVKMEHFVVVLGKKKSEILQPVFHLYMKVFRQVLGTHTCSYALNGYCVLSFSSV